jgi:hypothetical protein
LKLIVTINIEKERQQSSLNYKNIRMQVYELCGIIKYFKIVCLNYHDHSELAAYRPLWFD